MCTEFVFSSQMVFAVLFEMDNVLLGLRRIPFPFSSRIKVIRLTAPFLQIEKSKQRHFFPPQPGGWNGKELLGEVVHLAHAETRWLTLVILCYLKSPGG